MNKINQTDRARNIPIGQAQDEFRTTVNKITFNIQTQMRYLMFRKMYNTKTSETIFENQMDIVEYEVNLFIERCQKVIIGEIITFESQLSIPKSKRICNDVDITENLVAAEVK